MSNISAEQFVNTCAEALRRGKSEDEAGIYTDWLVSLLPMALPAFAWKVAQDTSKRGQLSFKFEVELGADGMSDPDSSADLRQMLKKALVFATCEDLGKQDSAGENAKLIYKPNWQDVAERARYLDPQFAYYAVRGDRIVTRASEGDAAVQGALQIHCVYIPDFTSNFPLPYELAGEAMEEVLSLALPGAAMNAKQ